MDEPSATLKPIINGYRQSNGMAQLNGAYKIDDEAAKNEIIN